MFQYIALNILDGTIGTQTIIALWLSRRSKRTVLRMKKIAGHDGAPDFML
jgi:hypothetical protein